MRLRATWILLPGLAAAGGVTYSVVSAQDSKPPFGYYPTKVSPSVAGPGNTIRPVSELPNDGPPTVTTAARKAAVETRPGTTSQNAWTPPKPKLTQPVISGPAGAVRQVAASEPTDPGSPRPPSAGLRVIPPPNMSGSTPEMPTASPKPPLMPAPSITVESSLSAEPKPLPLTSPTPMLPLPSIPSAPGSYLSNPPPQSISQPATQRAAQLVPSIVPPKMDPAPAVPQTLASTPAAPVLNAVPKILPPPATTPAATTTATLPADVPGIDPSTPIASTAMETKPSEPVTAMKSTVSSQFANMPLSSRNTPNLTLEAVAPESIGVGQNLSYELVVRNSGTTPVAAVRLEEEIPPGTKLVSTLPGSDSSTDRLVWNLGTLEAGAEKRVKIVILPAEEGEIRSRAVVTFSAATESRVKVTRPKLNIAIATAETVRVGDEVAFQIRISNTGSGAANKLMLQAVLSEGLHHPQGGVIETELPSIAAGESRPITLRAIATKAGPHHCSIMASADGNPAEKAKGVLTIVEPLLTTSISGPTKCLVRSEPEYKIELNNPGSAATDPVRVWVVIPEGFEVASLSDDGAFVGANRTASWKLSGLAAGTNKALTMKLRATAAVEGNLKAIAQAGYLENSGTDTTGVINVGNHAAARTLESKAETTVKAEGVPALRFEVFDVEDPVEVGKDATYEIRIINQGTAVCNNVQVMTTLADGTTIAGANGPTTARGQGQVVTFDAITQLGIKQEATFRLKVKGNTAGDQKIQVQVTCDQIRTPIIKEENTRFYKE